MVKKKSEKKQKQPHVEGFKLISSSFKVAEATSNQKPWCRVVGAVFLGHRWNTYGTMAHLGVPAAPILITPLPWYWLMETLSGLLGGGQA